VTVQDIGETMGLVSMNHFAVAAGPGSMNHFAVAAWIQIESASSAIGLMWIPHPGQYVQLIPFRKWTQATLLL
jgi:hypothetical protein